MKLFEVIIEVTRSTLTLENAALFACICGLKSHLKCSFLQYLEEKTRKFLPVEPCFCMSCMKCLSKCFCSKKPVLPWKISGCAPVTFNLTFHPNFHPNIWVFANLPIYRKLIHEAFALETLVCVILKKICIVFSCKYWHYNLG